MDAAEVARCGDDWRAEMLAWVHERLAAHGRTVTGPVEHRDRPWSIVMRVPADGGPVWFKANSPGARFEPALTLALGRWTPGNVLTPLAVDLDRGWSLLPDGGDRLRERLDAHPDPKAWEDALRQYASLQRSAAGHVEEMLGFGVPDLRPAALPERYDMLLSSPQVKAQVGNGGRLSAEQYQALCELRPVLAGWCDELAASGVPASIDHADLHDGQVFTAGGRCVFIDWADASVGHPYTSLMIAMQRAAERFGEAELARLRDAYLEPWTAEHDIADLRRAAMLAIRLGVIGRAMAWHRIFPEAEALVWDMHGRDVANFLCRLLDPGWSGA